MTIPRQLAPAVGLAHGGVEFLEGSLLGIERFTIVRIRKTHLGRICINFEFISSDFTIRVIQDKEEKFGLPLWAPSHATV